MSKVIEEAKRYIKGSDSLADLYIDDLIKEIERYKAALLEAADKIEQNRDCFYSGVMFVDKYRALAKGEK